MKHLVKHLREHHAHEIMSKSYRNCHVRGLDSILLLDSPEHRIRLFVARPEHELWKNTPRTLGSLAAHPHHCDITIEMTHGTLTNYTYRKQENGRFVGYSYRSAILDGAGSFRYHHLVLPVAFEGATTHDPRCQPLVLAAHTIHSVQVAKGRSAAWFVYEGHEDQHYAALSYSDQNLEQTSFEGLYESMTLAQIMEALELAQVL